MDFASTKVKLNNIKTYDSKTNNTTSVFKKKFYSDTSINSFDTYEDIDYNSIDLEEGISKSEGAKEWYEEGLNIANTIKDYGVTSGLSLVCGALELVENVGDALIMAGGAISSGIVSIWDKEKSEEIKSNTENVVKYDWTEKLYDESVKALNVDDEIAHGVTHTIGSAIGTTAAYVAISCVPGGAAVTASVGAITAFGSASEMALNSGADFDEALVCGTVAGIAGAASGGVLDKVQGLSAGSKTVGQLLKNTALGAVASASEPIVNTTAQYLAYGKDLVDENGNKVYDGYFDYYNKSGGLLQTGIASVVGGVSTGIQGIKGYIVVLFVSEILNGLVSLGLLIKETKVKIDFVNWIFKPGLAIILLNLIVRNFYCNSIFELITQILLFVVFYFIIVALFKGLVKSDLKF